MNKKQFGQFFTINANYILKNLGKFVINKDITDPFAGNGDLIKWALAHKGKKAIGYDIDKKYIDNKKIFYKDSILNKAKFNFVLTNPPYLNINKANKKIKEKYFYNFKFDDLYKISLFSIMDSKEGIAIVPINFLSSKNAEKIRKIFFSKFEIKEMNYFKQQVFPDTTYNVIAFYYQKKKNQFSDKFIIKTHIYPDNKIYNIELAQEFGWAIGGDLNYELKKVDNKLGIHRLTEEMVKKQKGNITIKAAIGHTKEIKKVNVSNSLKEVIDNNLILLKAIDSGTENGRIALENIKKEYDLDCLISKNSSRHMIYLIFDNSISVKEQKKLIKIFNTHINELREKYLSLFLTNYRDKDRKRISFNFVYKLLNYLYFNYIEEKSYNHQLALIKN